MQFENQESLELPDYRLNTRETVVVQLDAQALLGLTLYVMRLIKDDDNLLLVEFLDLRADALEI